MWRFRGYRLRYFIVASCMSSLLLLLYLFLRGDETNTREADGEIYGLRDNMPGFLFNTDGATDTFSHVIDISVVVNFSPFIEDAAHRRMLDPFNETKYCVMSPAIMQEGDGYLIAFRLQNCVMYHNNIKEFRTNLASDYLFIQPYTKKFEPTGSGYFLHVPYPEYQMSFYGGPQDPRAFKLNDKTYLTLNLIHPYKETGNQVIMEPIIYDLEQKLPIVPKVDNNVMIKHQQDKKFLQEKNWMPLVVQEELFFIQSLDPMLVLKCDDRMQCDYVNTNVDEPPDHVIRGGSPFQLYKWPYYIGTVHTVYKPPGSKEIRGGYNAHLVLIQLPDIRVVYVSDFLPINEGLYRKLHITLRRLFLNNFFYPVSLIVESSDTLLLGGHLSDEKSVLLRLSGIKAVINDVISRDKKSNPHGDSPRANVITNFFRSRLDKKYSIT